MAPLPRALWQLDSYLGMVDILGGWYCCPYRNHARIPFAPSSWTSVEKIACQTSYVNWTLKLMGTATERYIEGVQARKTLQRLDQNRYSSIDLLTSTKNGNHGSEA